MARHQATASAAVSSSVAAKALQDMASTVSVLDRPIVAADAITRELVSSPLLNDGVVDAALARQVAAASSPVWFAPTRDGTAVCVITPQALACSAATAVQQDGLAVAVNVSRNGVHTVGMARDDVRTADVVFADGSRVSVDVHDNLLSYRSESVPREIRWVGPNGPVTYRLPSEARS